MNQKNVIIAFLVSCSLLLANGQLDYYYYYSSCPNLQMIVKYGVWAAMKNDTRIAASLLRLHFHDCFVNGCDGSILLNDRKTFKGEQKAGPNINSIRGYEVIDNIKADVERACPSTVSCVDILTLAATEAVVLSGGPNWPVALGRRDGVTANLKAANTNLPSPFEPLANITAKFAAVGLDIRDVVVLSGAHTIGLAQCFTFKNRLFDFKGTGLPDPNLDTSLATSLKTSCPNVDNSNSNLNSLDLVTTYQFDNAYYKNLMSNAGLLESDQALMGHPLTASMVKDYSMYPYLFYKDFATSMVKLGNIGIITGQNGQVRIKCGEFDFWIGILKKNSLKKYEKPMHKETSTTPTLDPNQQQQPPPYPQVIQQQSYKQHSGHGSVGPVIGALAVIMVLGAIAIMIGRLCSGRRVMGHVQYDFEGWAETKCATCIDGRVGPPPVTAPVVVVVEEAQADEEMGHVEGDPEGHVEEVASQQQEAHEEHNLHES
uniref:Basic peroxidase n=1 Tax=Tanacetum cinerariifolium TaxID=118510 RepID=A0A6L2NNW5_TANCI|nr:peroxidase 10 [Tanacetum cinerariifolium]